MKTSLPFAVLLMLAGCAVKPTGQPAPTLPPLPPMSQAMPRASTLTVAVLPGPARTNILSLQINVPANGLHTTNAQFWQLQYSHDLATWHGLTNFTALSGYTVTNNVTSTNSRTFFRLILLP